MAEIVYDTAPGIRNMAVHDRDRRRRDPGERASTTSSQTARRSSPTTSFQITEPFFQDGVVAQAVDRAKAAGVTYLVSAGNRARQSWEGHVRGDDRPARRLAERERLRHRRRRRTPSRRIGTFTNREHVRLAAVGRAVRRRRARTSPSTSTRSARGTPTYAFTVDTDNIATGIPSEFVPITITRHGHGRHLDPPQGGRAQPVHEVHRRRRPRPSRSPSTPRTPARSTPTPRRRAAR